MSELIPSEIPGYTEAVAKENLIRDAAFLGITETVAGFDLVPMNLERWLILRIAKSPMLMWETPSPSELALFLWVLSPKFNRAGRGRWWFIRKCRWRLSRFSDVQFVIASARAYLEETFQDIPPTSGELSASYYSDAAWFCARLGAFGFSQEDVLQMPFKRLFQYLKVISQLEGSEVPLGNPSDRLVCNHFSDRN